MENINKDYIIYVLFGVVVLLITYIVLQEPEIKTVIETEYKTVVDEQVVYKKQECKKNIVNQDTKEEDFEIEDQVIQKDEFTLASTTDSIHSYQISIFSYEKPTSSMVFEKVVLNGILREDEEESMFILDVNKATLENLNEIYFKIKKNNTKKIYISRAECLYGLIENYIYHTNLEIFGDEIACDVSEDRELDEQSKKNKISGMIKNNELKGKISNMQAIGTKDF